MQSLSKRDLTPQQVADLVRASVGVDAVVERPMTDGMFNAAYRVRLADGRTALVKAAPPPGVPVLRYEHGIMRTEAQVYRLTERLEGVRVPRLLGEGPEHLVIDWLPGTPWSHLEPADPGPLRRELGRITARLNTVTAPDGRFGYPGSPFAELTAPDWPTAFTAMVEAILADAADWKVDLGTDADEVRALVATGLPALAEVREPRLVHFDLWPGNVFVDGDRISGLIDHERAFFGDPAAELVSLALGGDTGPDSELVRGYREVGGELSFSPAMRRRVLLYRLYLGLIMVTECAPRGSGPDSRAFAAQMLAAPLAELRLH